MAHSASAHAPSHGHTNYVAIWGILVALLVVSVVGPMLGIRLVTLITAFGIAIVKAYLVCTRFMHLNIEKKWVAYILAFMILMMVVFFAGVSPDVLKSTGHNWQKTYVEPAAGAAHPAEH